MGYMYRPYEQTYRCGGVSSYHGSCGANDCESCYPGCNAEQTTQRDLSECNYYYDPGSSRWSKLVSIRKHTARRDHKDGRIKKGQQYYKTTYRCVDDETGLSRHVHLKQVIEEAQA